MSLLKSLKNIGSYSVSKFKGDKELSAKYLSNILGEQKGIWLKFGQMMGTNASAFEDMTKLADSSNIEQVEFEVIEEEIKKHFPNWGDYIHSIDHKGTPASLSQVHKCISLKGDELVVKVQYPDIDKTLSSQLKKIGWLSAVEHVNKDPKRNFKINEYLKSIESMIEHELDYFHEIDNLNKFDKHNKEFPLVSYPIAHQELFNRKAYVMSEVYGEKFIDFLNSSSPDQKKDIAIKATKAFLKHLLVDGFFQGDSHIGNFLITPDQRIGFIDFGHFIELNDQERKAIYLLIDSKINQKDQNLGTVLNALGFDLDKISLIKNKIPLLFNQVLYPFGLDYALNLNKWSPKKEMESILGDDKWWFRTSGSSRFFLIIRSLFGMHNFLKRLDSPIFFKKIFNELKAEIENSLTNVNLIEKELPGVSFQALASKLRVKVTDNGVVKVDISLPSMAFSHIEDIINDDIKAEMEKNFIDISQLKRIYLSRGLPPSKVIDQTIGSKNYQVWLE